MYKALGLSPITIKKKKKAGGVAQAVEYLLSKPKALSIAKKKKKKKKKLYSPLSSHTKNYKNCFFGVFFDGTGA
jgi:hypothetical protein